jgi:glycosyltransferase involved in cell wall biosynthesis
MPKQIALAQFIYGKCFKVVAITDKMQNLIQGKYQLKNLVRIYNPIDVNYVSNMANEGIDLDYEFVISAGHFNTNQKQFDKLILAYSKSILPTKGIALVILGEGVKKEELSRLPFTNEVGSLGHFLCFKENPFKYFSKAKFFIMTSLHEGMPMVLIESLACGTPVIAFDCPTGPQEIIRHEMNGFLIDNQNMEKLIQEMDTMINDNSLYSNCKMNAQKSIEKFSINAIGKEWLELMNFN